MCTDRNASECNYIDLQTIRAMKHEQHMQVWEVLGSLLSRTKKWWPGQKQDPGDALTEY